MKKKLNEHGTEVLDTRDMKIIKCRRGMFRFVDMDLKIASRGFYRESGLKCYRDNITITIGIEELMRKNFDKYVTASTYED